MPSIFSRRLLLLAAVAATGCAALIAPTTIQPPERGPPFLLNGRLAMKKLGKPMLRAKFTWARGNGFSGWEEKITFTDPIGRRLAKIVTNEVETQLITKGNRQQVSNVAEILAQYTGIELPVAILASWLEGSQNGAPILDYFVWQGIHVEILERDYNTNKPHKLRLTHRHTKLALWINRQPET